MVLIFWNTIFARHNFLCKKPPQKHTHHPLRQTHIEQ